MGFMAAFVISEWLNLVRSRDAVDPAGYSGLFYIRCRSSPETGYPSEYAKGHFQTWARNLLGSVICHEDQKKFKKRCKQGFKKIYF